jgi:hypothetical protein
MSDLVLRKIISGGQVGADEGSLRAAVILREAAGTFSEFAMWRDLETGGFMPRGWKTKAGPQPYFAERYGMVECRSGGYPTRTRLNVEAADATVRFAYDFTSAGERLTLRFVRQYAKPYFDVPLTRPPSPQAPLLEDGSAGDWDGTYRPLAEPAELRSWLVRHQVRVLNVAGNGNPAIRPIVTRFLLAALAPDGPYQLA